MVKIFVVGITETWRTLSLKGISRLHNKDWRSRSTDVTVIDTRGERKRTGCIPLLQAPSKSMA